MISFQSLREKWENVEVIAKVIFVLYKLITANK